MRYNEYDQYDHSRARECLGLALGFLMNYDELWSSNRVPFRIAERREDCGEKNADQAPEIPNSGCHHIESHRHIDISTYRHGMSQAAKHEMKKVRIIKEPWDTPQRATPKSCYPCKN